MAPYTLVKYLDVAEAKIGEYAHLIRTGRIGPVVDGCALRDYPVEVVADEAGPHTVVVSAGEPRIEVNRTDDGEAVLVGTWDDHRIERNGPQYKLFLDSFRV